MKDFELLHEELQDFQIFNIVPNGRNIYYTLVDSSGRRYDMEVRDFRPYFFVPKQEIKWHKPFLKIREVNKIVLNHPAQVYKERDKYKFTYEADLSYDIRFSVDMNVQYEKKKAKEVPLHIWFADIEVYRNGKEGRPDYRNETNIVNAISFYDTLLDKYFSIVVVPDKSIQTGKLVTKNEQDNTEIILLKVKDEEQLFRAFVHLLNKLKPVIITGWNFINFDITYIIQRIKHKYPDMLPLLSPHFNVEPNLKLNDSNSNDIFIPGLTVLDLQLIYKLFTTEKRDAYTLDFIAKEELGEGKVDYIGSLDYIWKNNFDTFLKYSYKDVQLLVELEKKKQFILLVNELKEVSGLPLYYFNFNYTLKFNDALVLKYIRTKTPEVMVYRSKPKHVDQYEIKGGFVKIPKIGFHYWVIDLDASSMYPSGMVSYNISPETFLGRFLNIDVKDIQQYIRPFMFNKISEHDLPKRLQTVSFVSPNGKIIDIDIRKLKASIYKVTSTFTIAPNGSMFNMEIEPAVFPLIQQDLKSTRKIYKDLMKVWKIFDNYSSNIIEE